MSFHEARLIYVIGNDAYTIFVGDRLFDLPRSLTGTINALVDPRSFSELSEAERGGVMEFVRQSEPVPIDKAVTFSAHGYDVQTDRNTRRDYTRASVIALVGANALVRPYASQGTVVVDFCGGLKAMIRRAMIAGPSNAELAAIEGAWVDWWAKAPGNVAVGARLLNTDEIAILAERPAEEEIVAAMLESLA